jgi:hypothetical protein
LEELERNRKGGEELGFHGEATGKFIEHGEVRIGISLAAMAGMQTVTMVVSERESWREVAETDARRMVWSSRTFGGI